MKKNAFVINGNSGIVLCYDNPQTTGRESEGSIILIKQCLNRRWQRRRQDTFRKLEIFRIIQFIKLITESYDFITIE